MNEWFDAERHVERAHEAFEAGRWDDAEVELREALARDPNRADWHFNLGLTLEAAGRYESAIEAFENAHALEPGEYSTVLLLGVNCLRANMVDRAIAWLDRSHRLDHARIDPLVHLIEAHVRQGDHERAEECFYLALQSEGNAAAAYSNIAESLLERGKYERAAYCLREASKLSDEVPRVFARLAFASEAMGRVDEARDLYLKELKQNPGDTDALIDLGRLLARMERYAEASEKFRRALELESNSVEAHFELGDIAERQHRTAEAIAAFRLVMRLAPGYPSARPRLASLLLRSGDLSGSRRLLHAEAKNFTKHPEQYDAGALDRLSDLLLSALLTRKALRVAERWAEVSSEDPAAWHRLAVCRFETGLRTAGMEAERRALRLNPKHLAALHNMALACIERREWRRAKAFLSLARRIDPDDDGLRRLALSMRLGRFVNWCRGVFSRLA